jgi:large subunit ribosomal protein L44e
MKIRNQMMTYCPYCNKHTLHKVELYHAGSQRGQTVGTRRHKRAIKGYVGSVEAKIRTKKISKKQKMVLQCTVCKKSTERVIGGRTKKRLEIKK